MSARLARPLLLACALAAAAAAQSARPAAPKPQPPRRPAPAKVVVTSTSELFLDNGGDFTHERFPLEFVNGDWFSTAGDANATLTLESPGPHPLRLDLQWTGTGPRHVINRENNTDLGGSQTFFLTMPGNGIYSLSSGFRDDDAVSVTVATIDDHDIDATLGGRFDGSLAVNDNAKLASRTIAITGAIRLHRDVVPARITTGTYGTCDPIVHDRFSGAEARSPSNCESKFDADVRAAIAKAMEKVVRSFQSAGWMVDAPQPKPITTAARHSEDKPYRLDFSQPGATFTIQMQMSEASPAYAEYRKLAETIRNPENFKPDNVQQMAAMMSRLEHETKARILVHVNMPLGGFTAFTRDHTMLEVPGAVIACSASHAQAPTGGGLDASGPVSVVYLGRWSPPAFKPSGEGERLEMAAAFVKGAPTLAVQNVEVRIFGSSELSRKIVEQIDFAQLTGLIK